MKIQIVPDKQNEIKGTWVLQKNFQSPWNSKIVPIFLDFDRINNHVFISGYDEKEGSTYKYDLTKGLLKIGDHLQFDSLEIYDNRLVGKIGDLKFTYYLLLTGTNEIDAKRLVKVLIKHTWGFGSDILEFKTDLAPINLSNSYNMIEYRNGKQFYGSYSLITLNKNLFLIILVDGKYLESVYRVKKLNNSEIELEDSEKEMRILRQQD